MKAVILNNKIQIVNNYTFVKITIQIPFGNIQKMKVVTNATIYNVKEVKLNFNHNAGKIAIVEIGCQFCKIEKYLTQTSDIFGCENLEEYKKLIGGNNVGMSYNESNLTCDKLSLYIFGDPIIRNKTIATNGIYRNINGKKISLQGKLDNYVNFKGEYYSLVKTA
jgi:hypothetical protein